MDEQLDPTPQASLLASILSHVEGVSDLLHPRRIERVNRNVTEWAEAIETDLVEYLRPVLTTIAEHPDIPEQARTALDTLLHPEHQSQLAIAFAGVYALVRTLVDAAIQPYAQGVASAAWSHHPIMPLSPAEVALATIRNQLEGVDPYAEVAKSGVDPQRFNVLVKNTGEPISLQEGLLLFRRGKIDLARLTTLVRQSRIRDEWLPEVLELRYAPPPAGEVVAGLLKGHLGLAEAATKLGEAGIDPANLGWMEATAGRPPGPVETLQLWNRGWITEAQVDQVIRQSDINNQFLDIVKMLRWYYPPPRSIVAMHRRGTITDDQARQLYREHGVPEFIVDYFIADAHETTTTSTKELTAAQVLRFYGARMIDRDEATFRLAALRYPAAAIELQLDYADGERHERYAAAVMNRVHARFIGWHINEGEVRALLQADGIPVAAVNDALALWELERAANFRDLTPAMIVGAYRRKQIGPAETKGRLLAMGILEEDLAIVVADGYPPTHPNPAAVQAVLDA